VSALLYRHSVLSDSRVVWDVFYDTLDSDTAVDATAGHTASKEYYTWNVRVAGGEEAPEAGSPAPSTRPVGAPPAPEAVEAPGPPG